MRRGSVESREPRPAWGLRRSAAFIWVELLLSSPANTSSTRSQHAQALGINSCTLFTDIFSNLASICIFIYSVSSHCPLTAQQSRLLSPMM